MFAVRLTATASSLAKGRLCYVSQSSTLCARRVFAHNTRHLGNKSSSTSSSLFATSTGSIRLLGRRLFGAMTGRGVGASTANGQRVGKEMSSTEIMRKLFNFVWPKDNIRIRVRVVVALTLLIGAKLLNVCVPFLFKEIVDFLNKHAPLKGDENSPTSSRDKLLMVLIALVVGYGAARASSSLFGELRSAIFATVAQSSVTQLATRVFRHLHQLDLNFHLNR